MRYHAYLKVIAQAKALPTKIPELSGYFGDSYNPSNIYKHMYINN